MTRMEITKKVMKELSREELENLVIFKMAETGAVAKFATGAAIMAQVAACDIIGDEAYQRGVETQEKIVTRQVEILNEQSQIIRNN